MYIIKNAMRSISRAKGRNLLIGIIALVIATSACVALSIKESAVKAKEDTLSSMEITAQISQDRQSMMSSATSDGNFDRDAMKNMLQNSSSLTLDEYKTYSKAESVKSFYYTLTVSLNANDDIEPVDSSGTFSRDDSSDTEKNKNNAGMQMPGGSNNNFKGMMGNQGDFTVVGYSSDKAMTGFVDGTMSIIDGSVFEEGTQDNNCIISEDLATYNNIAVGSKITLLNPNDEDEAVTFTIVGIYKSTATEDEGSMGGFSTANDSSNKILTSYDALNAIVETSNESATETTDDDTGRTTSTAISHQLSATYVFNGIDDYNDFGNQVKDLGLSDNYIVTSSDVTSFEESLTPLENLSNMANYFLYVVFSIGAIILVVLNIFNIRERKYEIGVLTAIGMKKGKVALQFIIELFTITLAAIIIGAGIGAATSVPVTNALLSTQISSKQSSNSQIQQNFGREPGQNSLNQGDKQGAMSGKSPDSQQQGNKGIMNKTVNYVSEISYSTDLKVIGELILVGVGLTLISSLAAVAFIMRYEPLKILSSRD